MFIDHKLSFNPHNVRQNIRTALPGVS